MLLLVQKSGNHYIHPVFFTGANDVEAAKSISVYKFKNKPIEGNTYVVFQLKEITDISQLEEEECCYQEPVNVKVEVNGATVNIKFGLEEC